MQGSTWSWKTHNSDSVNTQFLVMEPDFVRSNRNRIQSYSNPNKNTVKTLYSVRSFFHSKKF